MQKRKTVITYGTYDMLHIGHLNLLKRAKALGDYLIVGVTDENYDRSRGKLNVSESTKKRVKAIEALDFVDKVIVETHKKQKAIDIMKFDVDIFAIGDDWVGAFDYLKKYTKVVYLPRTEGISSTKLRGESFKPIKLGISGLARDIEAFLDEAEFVSNIEVTRIYDRDIDAVREFTKSSRVKYGHDNYNEFLDTTISAVYINSEVKEHYIQIKMALEADKHVLCENPLALQKNELKELLALAKSRRRILLSALRTAFLPAFNQLLRKVQKGVIGEVREVRATRTTLYKEKNYPKKYIEQGATNLLSSYPSLLIHKILGKSRKINFFDYKEDGYDISNTIVTKHKSGIGIATVATGVKSEDSAIIAGTKGYIYLPDPWWLTRSFSLRYEDSSKSVTYEYEFEGCGLRYMLAEFSSLIQRGKIESKRLSPTDMMKINRIVLQYNEKNIVGES